MEYSEKYKECCRLLNVDEDADDTELYNAYLTACKKYDPAKYPTDVLKEMAKKRLERIAEAFGYIKSHRGTSKSGGVKNRTLYIRSDSEYSKKCLDAANRLWSYAEYVRGKKLIMIPPGKAGSAYLSSCAYAMLLRHSFEFIVRNSTRSVSADPLESPPEWAFSLMKEDSERDIDAIKLLSEVKDVTDDALSYASFLSQKDLRTEMKRIYKDGYGAYLSQYRKENKKLYSIKHLDRLKKALSSRSSGGGFSSLLLRGHLYSLLIYSLSSYVCSEKNSVDIDYPGEFSAYDKLAVMRGNEELNYFRMPSFITSSADNMHLCACLLKRVCHYIPESVDLSRLCLYSDMDLTNQAVYRAAGMRSLLRFVRGLLYAEYGVYSHTAILNNGRTDRYHDYILAEGDRVFNDLYTV